VIEIREEPITALDEHGRISIAFDVHSVIDVAALDSGFAFTERQVDAWTKDYYDMGALGARFVRATPLNGLDESVAAAIVALFGTMA
jgi:hypothetical protein